MTETRYSVTGSSTFLNKNKDFNLIEDNLHKTSWDIN